MTESRWIDFVISDLERKERYHLLTQTVIPRPVAWIVTESDQSPGTWNLAPYSFFNVVASEPPVLVVGVNSEDHPNSKNDTLRNLQSNPHLTVNIPSSAAADLVTATAEFYGADESEAKNLRIELEPWTDWPVPSVRLANISLACRVQQELDVGVATQAILLLRVERARVAADAVVAQETGIRVDVGRIDPLARVGGGRFVSISEPFRANEVASSRREEAHGGE